MPRPAGVTHLGRFRDEYMHTDRDCDGKKWVDRLAVYEEMKNKFDGQFETGVKGITVKNTLASFKRKIASIHETQSEHDKRLLEIKEKTRLDKIRYEKDQKEEAEMRQQIRKDRDDYYEKEQEEMKKNVEKLKIVRKLKEVFRHEEEDEYGSIKRDGVSEGHKHKEDSSSNDNNHDNIGEGGKRDKIDEDQSTAGASDGRNDKDETRSRPYYVNEDDDNIEEDQGAEGASIRRNYKDETRRGPHSVNEDDETEKNEAMIDSDDDRQENYYKIQGRDSEGDPGSRHKQSYCDAIRHQRRNIYAV